LSSRDCVEGALSNTLLTYYITISLISSHSFLRSAVGALLNICKDFSVAVLEAKFTISKALVEGCEVFLKTLVDLNCDTTLLPREGFAASMKKPLEDELVTTWLASVSSVQGRASSSSSTSSGRARVQGSGMARGLMEKAHLVLFAPVAYKLLVSQHSELRELASIISANVDLASVVMAYTETMERVEALEIENERLRQENSKLSSSQGLTF